MKRGFLIGSILLAVIGGCILLRCLSLSAAFGGIEYGDFMQFVWVGYDTDMHQMSFADYPTGERPWYSFIQAWWIGFGCLGLSAASVVAYRNLAVRPARC